MNRGNIKAMYFHSIKMMELCKDIASNLGIFNDEEITVCGLIGLFHDIGMFSNKFKNVLTFEDNTDKSKESIEILFENGNKAFNKSSAFSKYSGFNSKSFAPLVEVACSGNTIKFAFCLIASSIKVLIFFKFVSKSPIISLICANAIFIFYSSFM